MAPKITANIGTFSTKGSGSSPTATIPRLEMASDAQTTSATRRMSTRISFNGQTPFLRPG